MKVRWLLSVSAVLYWFFAVMKIFNARVFQAPLGDVTDTVVMVTQSEGAILLGLGVINWMVRSVTNDHALTAILVGNLVWQVAMVAIVARALMLHLFAVESGGVNTAIFHGLLGIGFAVYLVRTHRATRSRQSRAASRQVWFLVLWGLPGDPEMEWPFVQ